MGMADINIELEKQTADMLNKYRDTIKQETGIDSSISELDMKNYVKEVMAEIQKAGEGKSSTAK